MLVPFSLLGLLLLAIVHQPGDDGIKTIEVIESRESTSQAGGRSDNDDDSLIPTFSYSWHDLEGNNATHPSLIKPPEGWSFSGKWRVVIHNASSTSREFPDAFLNKWKWIREIKRASSTSADGNDGHRKSLAAAAAAIPVASEKATPEGSASASSSSSSSTTTTTSSSSSSASALPIAPVALNPMMAADDIFPVAHASSASSLIEQAGTLAAASTSSSSSSENDDAASPSFVLQSASSPSSISGASTGEVASSTSSTTTSTTSTSSSTTTFLSSYAQSSVAPTSSVLFSYDDDPQQQQQQQQQHQQQQHQQQQQQHAAVFMSIGSNENEEGQHDELIMNTMLPSALSQLTKLFSVFAFKGVGLSFVKSVVNWDSFGLGLRLPITPHFPLYDRMHALPRLTSMLALFFQLDGGLSYRWNWSISFPIQIVYYNAAKLGAAIRLTSDELPHRIKKTKAVDSVKRVGFTFSMRFSQQTGLRWSIGPWVYYLPGAVMMERLLPLIFLMPSLLVALVNMFIEIDAHRFLPTPGVTTTKASITDAFTGIPASFSTSSSTSSTVDEEEAALGAAATTEQALAVEVPEPSVKNHHHSRKRRRMLGVMYWQREYLRWAATKTTGLGCNLGWYAVSRKEDYDTSMGSSVMVDIQPFFPAFPSLGFLSSFFVGIFNAVCIKITQLCTLLRPVQQPEAATAAAAEEDQTSEDDDANAVEIQDATEVAAAKEENKQKKKKKKTSASLA